MIKRISFYIICLVVICFFTYAEAASYVKDDAALKDMYKNPFEYYYLYSSGTGLSNYLDIKSFSVEIYNPPIYIISFKEIEVSRGPGGAEGTYVGYSRYKYDYNTRKAYYEKIENGKHVWEEITYFKMVAAADLVFAIGYNMHFYDKYSKDNLAERYLLGDKVLFENMKR